jgi:dihydroorotate dehydrogenase (fumarate)
MGVALKNPVVVGACSLSGMIDDIRRIEEAGTGALVIKSLFEEQVMLESEQLEEQRLVGSERFGESITYFPDLRHAGPRGHLMWVEKTRQAVALPLFASLNAMQSGTWGTYARQLADTGVNGLELNLYAVQADPNKTGAEVEKRLFDAVEQVKSEVKIPVAVKLSPFYSSMANVAAELDRRGAGALVLFNRFLQPDIDIEKEILWNRMTYSHPNEMRLPLRWIALLHGRLQANLAASTGAYSAEDVIKYILAGADVVQVASTLYRNGINYIGKILEGIGRWMDRKGYATLADFRGRLSQKDATDPFVFERAQYVELLMKQKEYSKPSEL